MIRICLAGRRAPRCLALLAWAALVGGVRAEPDLPQTLDAVSVVATRTPADVRTLGTEVDVLSAADLERQQLGSVAEALGLVTASEPAVNGAAGADASVFLRGANSDQTLFLVDGLRLNDANTDYAVFLGGARLGATDALEVVQGPQSTLYGSEAVGGVISVSAQKGQGDPSASLEVGAGSFGAVDASLVSQGARQGWAWSASRSDQRTENTRPNNAFSGSNLVVRVDRDISESVALGATLRGFEGRYGDPGDVYTNDAYAHEDEGNWLATVFAVVKPAPDWSARVTLGGQDRRYVAFDEVPGVYTEATVVQNHRGVLDAQATYAGLAAQKITAGVTLEDESTLDTGYGGIDRRQSLVGVFAEDEAHPTPPLYATLGLRYDSFDTFGSAVTGRATLAWLSPARTLKLRASAGTGFNAPSFLELYGAATGYQGNPGLSPERSTGGDAGLDWYLPDGKGSIGATGFRTDTRDLVVYDFSVYPGTTANVGRARSSGVELEATLKPGAGLEFRGAYTYLQADDLTDQVRLLRRPRHSVTADLWRDFGGGLSGGVGVRGVAGAEDVDALTYATVNQPGYAVARAYAAWRATARLTLRLRLENILNKAYQPVNGYPAAGASVFGAASWRL